MTTFILGALDEEISSLRSAMNNMREEKAGAFDLYIGEICGKKIILCRCGVGKVNAAAAASAVLTSYTGVIRVINTGVAGGIGGGIRRGDVALGTMTVQHDYDQTPDGFRKGQIEGFDSEFFKGDKTMLSLMERALTEEKISYKKGVIASGDQFIADSATARRINREFDAIACDFESAPIAQVCALFGVPYLAMRAISDDGREDAVSSFYEFLSSAAEKNARAIKRFMSY